MFKKLFIIAFIIAVATGMMSTPAQADGKQSFTIAWSHYTGWEPWQYAKDSGIMKKWADKYGIEVKITDPMGYVDSLNQYTSGAFAGVVVTNMDTLAMPAVGGVDSDVVIMGDYSNGNDGVVVKNGTKMSDIKGRKVNIIEFTVSHYLLSQCLSKAGMSEKDVKLVNAQDEGDLTNAYVASSDAKKAAVTWNPFLMTLRNDPGSNMVCDSSQIPGDIQDLLIVRHDAPESLKKALAGAWYEIMATMSKPGAAREKAVKAMSDSAGGTLGEFEAQLKTTAMYYNPADAAAFTRGEVNKSVAERVRTFLFEHKLLGNAKNKDAIGIQFPDGTVIGNKSNVKMRYVDTYMQLAADGKL